MATRGYPKVSKNKLCDGPIKVPHFQSKFLNFFKIVPQLTKLINMNHNRLPNFSKNISQQRQRWGTKLEIKILLNQWGETTWTQYTFKNVYQKLFPNSISNCPIFFAKIVLGCIVYNKAKGKHVHIILLVVKAFIWRALKILVLVVKDQLKKHWAFGCACFGMHLQLL